MDTWDFGSARLELLAGDITHQRVDAIANAANGALAGGGGVDGAIHRAAGPELMRALDEIRPTLPGQRLAPGGAVITPGYRLAARHVIHCVGPIYARAGAQAPELLASCYTRALALCVEHGLISVAFPSISTGVYGYPLDDAAHVALTAIGEALGGARTAPASSAGLGGVELVRFVLFEERSYEAYAEAAMALFGAAR